MGHIDEDQLQGSCLVIMGARLEANTFNITYLTGADTILPFHAHDQGDSGNITKCQNEIGME